MRMRRFLVLSAVLLAVVMAPAAARADTPFHADSGDACPYGVTEGLLIPKLTAVVAAGTLTDRPVPLDPGFCRDDGSFSIATFKAYTADGLVSQQAVRADNGTVKFELVLGGNSTFGSVQAVEIQVCRTGVHLPVIYCGKLVRYGAPF